MEVETFQPNGPIVRVSPDALQHIRRQLAGRDAKGVRLEVTQSGCSGYMYKLDFATGSDTTDIVLSVAADVSLYIAPQALPLVEGTEIHYVVDGLNSALKFHNPRAHSECGCGESFAL